MTTSPHISSKMIMMPVTPALLDRLATFAPIEQMKALEQVGLSIFEVAVHGNTRYCCWAGGKFITAPEGVTGPPIPALTPVGQATVETMVALPFFQGKLSFFQLVMGPTPLPTKVLDAFAATPSDMMLCFFGDLAGELDGAIAATMNPVGSVDLKDCIGIPPPTSTTRQ